MYEEQIIWHGLTPLHFSHLIAPACLPSQDIHHNPNLLPCPPSTSILQSFFLQYPLPLSHFCVQCSCVLLTSIMPWILCWPLPPPASSPYPSQLLFGTSWDISQASSPTPSPGATQHQKPGCERQQHWQTCPYRDSQNKSEQGNEL